MANIPQPQSVFQGLFEKMLFIKPHMDYCLLRNTESEEEESLLESSSLLKMDDDFNYSKPEVEVSFIIKEEPEDEPVEIFKEEQEGNISMLLEENKKNLNTFLGDEGSEKPVDGIENALKMCLTKNQKKKLDRDYPSLIREVKIRPVLWNLAHPMHKNRIIMTKSWDEIGEALDQKCEFLSIFLRLDFL